MDTDILKGKRILFVDDNYMVRILAVMILSQYGAEVTEAEDGKIAIEKIEQGVYDLILMDVQMPIKDGIETTQYIRNNISRDIPIIALTANDLNNEEARCIEAGMNAFLSKPFDEHKLVQLVAGWLGKSLNDPDYLSGTESKGAKLFDLDKLKVISRGNDSFVIKMTTLFVDTMPDMLQQMEQAYNNKNYETIAEATHRIKSSIHIMCITSLDKDLEVLEDCKRTKYSDAQISNHIQHLKMVINEVIRQIQV